VKRRCLIISAVNLTEGGPLSVLQDFVAAACDTLAAEWDIVVFLHDRRLVAADRPRFIEVPYAKRSWLLRLWVEWHQFRGHAARLRPDLWISLQDISPNVGDVRQAVYCHNPIPFFPVRWRDAFFQPKHLAFRLAYAWLYRINLRRNCAVVVQQSWLRDQFRNWVGQPTQIIVAHPCSGEVAASAPERAIRRPGPASFLYPALPRTFKNLELICRAVERLEAGSAWCSEVLFTVDGTENRYARWLKRRFGKLKTLRFMGRQSREQLRGLYQQSDCLLFPSRIETWGLPISEAQQHRLPMFVADLPYAKETVGAYDRVEFFDVDDDEALAAKLLAFQLGSFAFRPASMGEPQQPFVRGLPELVALLTEACPPLVTADH
jgi:glycosyltransferase involved in cell wall biosynthesis